MQYFDEQKAALTAKNGAGASSVYLRASNLLTISLASQLNYASIALTRIPFAANANFFGVSGDVITPIDRAMGVRQKKLSQVNDPRNDPAAGGDK